MKINYLYPLTLLFILFFTESCRSSRSTGKSSNTKDINEITSTVVISKRVSPVSIQTKNKVAGEVVSYAESLKGIRYQYGGTSKETGFDCSGFIWHVFNRFDIKVPRKSADFTNAGREVPISECRRGDIILFTGSNPKSGIVGHMGIITKKSNDNLYFIHAASGGGKGIMISGMSEYFVTRFVKVIRVFTVF